MVNTYRLRKEGELIYKDTYRQIIKLKEIGKYERFKFYEVIQFGKKIINPKILTRAEVEFYYNLLKWKNK